LPDKNFQTTLCSDSFQQTSEYVLKLRDVEVEAEAGSESGESG